MKIGARFFSVTSNPLINMSKKQKSTTLSDFQLDTTTSRIEFNL
jgi:hypothetical protein